MAKKNDTSAPNENPTAAIAQRFWEVTNNNGEAHRQMSAQFHAIGEALGWRGAAARLAKTGQEAAALFGDGCNDECDIIRDLREDANSASKGAAK